MLPRCSWKSMALQECYEKITRECIIQGKVTDRGQGANWAEEAICYHITGHCLPLIDEIKPSAI